jgi:ABC-2 type transport system permease protein
MAKVWLIAQHHFFQEVRKRTFIIVLFSLPLFLAVSVGAGYLAASLEDESATLGYVDQAGLLANTTEASGNDQVRLVAFDTPEAARQALESGRIDAYYALTGNARTRRADLVFFKPPEYEVTSYFDDVVRRGLLADQPPAVVERVLSGPKVTVRAVEQHRDFPSGGPGASQMLLVIVASIFAFLVMTTSGYMMEVVVAEKENRTMEIVASSVSPALR